MGARVNVMNGRAFGIKRVTDTESDSVLEGTLGVKLQAG